MQHATLRFAPAQRMAHAPLISQVGLASEFALWGKFGCPDASSNQIQNVQAKLETNLNLVSHHHSTVDVFCHIFCLNNVDIHGIQLS